jgi:hypothetical protein
MTSHSVPPQLLDAILVGDSWVRVGNVKTWPELMCKMNNWKFINIGVMGAKSSVCFDQLDKLQQKLDHGNYVINEHTLWIIRHGGNDVLRSTHGKSNVILSDSIKIFRTKYGKMDSAWMRSETDEPVYFPMHANMVAKNTTEFMNIVIYLYNAKKFIIIPSPVSIQMPLCKYLFSIGTPMYAKTALDSISYIMQYALYRDLILLKQTHRVHISMFDETLYFSQVTWTWDGFHLGARGRQVMANAANTYYHDLVEFVAPVYTKSPHVGHYTSAIISTAFGSIVVKGIADIFPVKLAKKIFHKQNGHVSIKK